MKRLIPILLGCIVLVLGVTVAFGQGRQQPVEDLTWVRVEAGESYWSLARDLGLSCTHTDLWAANGRQPLDPGTIVFVPPWCLTPPSTTSTTSTTAAPPTTTQAPTTTVPASGIPTPQTTGSRIPIGQLTPFNGEFFTTSHGQVVQGLLINGNLNIRHDNVIVRDVVVRYDHNYGLDIRSGGGVCPQGARFEYVEVDGRNASDTAYAVYGEGCPWTLDHAYIHNIGSGVLINSDNTVTNSYIYSSRYETSGAHRNAVQHHGGARNVVSNNVLYCEGGGCSSALALYGEAAPVRDILIEGNVLATTGAYCTYTGSLPYKPHPDGSNVRYVNNRFSTKFRPNCGASGPVTGSTAEVRGNVWSGNVWHETGAPLN